LPAGFAGPGGVQAADPVPRSPMAETSGRTVVCSVLFLDIVEYSKQTVADQASLKERFNALLAQSLETVAARDRVILDTGDGAAIAFLGAPEDGLFVALAIRDQADGLPIRMGINLGPARLVKDLNGQVNIIGDSINVAQRVMSFSEPGQLLVSRSYYEVVSCLSADYAGLFTHQGSRTDKHVRAHEVYSVGIASSPDRQRAATSPEPLQPAAPIFVTSPPADAGPAKVLDAGANLIISGGSRESVQQKLDELAGEGARLISPITQMGNKWMATCEHPKHGMSDCKVQAIGSQRIITGSSREAVADKLDELMRFGAKALSPLRHVNGVWTVVCDTGN
jgi:class 3 adenylate cyclase